MGNFVQHDNKLSPIVAYRERTMNVYQALICGSGKGGRLGMGPKSHIVYRGKLLLEYVIESAIKAGINRIVVTMPSMSEYARMSSQKVKLAAKIRKKYPKVFFIHDDNIRFRDKPDLVRDYLDLKRPFFILGGHNPQSARFLRDLASLYKKNRLVMSAYRYKFDTYAILAVLKQNKVIDPIGKELIRPRVFRADVDRRVLLFPTVLDYSFYDHQVKSKNGPALFQDWPKIIIKNGGSVYALDNPIPAEVDYKRDLPSLYSSIDYLFKK